MLDSLTQRAWRIAHSVQVGYSEISENSNALPYALCPLLLVVICILGKARKKNGK
jgi:hypothetical protein